MKIVINRTEEKQMPWQDTGCHIMVAMRMWQGYHCMLIAMHSQAIETINDITITLLRGYGTSNHTTH